MKLLLLLFAFLLHYGLASAQTTTPPKHQSTIIPAIKKQQYTTVYIWEGGGACTYNQSENWSVLNWCTHSISAVQKTDTEKS